MPKVVAPGHPGHPTPLSDAVVKRKKITHVKENDSQNIGRN